MANNLESQIKALFSIQRRVQAQLGFYRIQEAYNFGKIGLAVTDGNKNVIWINEFLTDMDFDVVDCKIDEISPDLLKLSSSDYEEETVKIIYKKHNYEVKFIESANLYIFKDITDYESIFNYSKNLTKIQKLC